ncbi:MAG: ABC transporter permease [Parvularculaceae bacterium]
MDIQTIPLARLAFALIPAAGVIVLMQRWRISYGKTLYAFLRMFVQLMIIGYALVYIFAADSGLVVSAVLAVMVVASGAIALNTIKSGKRALFPASLASIFVGGGVTLACVVIGVLRLEPWYAPHMTIPLAGMIFSNSMTSVSLAAERLASETANGAPYAEAKITAFQTAMIPVVNALLAVGLVALPGMMTGQILSGVSPLIAVRYQIMVMCMIFGSAGLSTALFVHLARNAPAFAGAVASGGEEQGK